MDNGTLENRRITVDDATYELRPWSYRDGRRWLYRLVGVLASASGLQATESAAIGAVLASVDEATCLYAGSLAVELASRYRRS